MPRKLKRYLRNRPDAATTHSQPQSPRSRAVARSAVRFSRREFYQCIACGALTDPMYGADASSWCPHCDKVGMVVFDDGKIPDPQMYGAWLKEQQRASPASSSKDGQPFLALPNIFGRSIMKHKIRHSGIYSCPECCIEYDLTAVEVLKCDDCGRPLVSGPLDELGDDEEHFTGELS